MKIVEHKFQVKSRKDEFRFYVLGDVHIGALNCAEDEFRRFVSYIKNTPNSYWVGGGDYCDAVILKDAMRFDVNTLPNWMLSGDATATRRNMGDMLVAQRSRFLNMVAPIKDKCLGLIEGNHEYSIFKHHNSDHLQMLCDSLDVQNLSDCAFLRWNFGYAKTATNTTTRGSIVNVFICHGRGGGRSSGAEPNKLYQLAADKDTDIVLTGHTHSFCIHPPIPMLTIPRRGALPENPIITEKHAINWGSFVHGYSDGPSTYASRALYPLRPMYTVEIAIQPHRFSQTGKKDGKADTKTRQLASIDVRPHRL
jgi:predicted phosphodiesterase